MKANDAPQKQPVPFGANGPREDITATTPTGSNQASYDQGFPPITMTLKSAGGLPPKGQDMNQILFEQSSFNRYFAAGGGYSFDPAFSTQISGYPGGAFVPNSTKTGFWINAVDDNSANPENATAALTGWTPALSYGTTNLTGLASSSLTMSTLMASKDRIVLSGNLTANINIVLPAWVKKWDVINNCTGAYTVTLKTSAGSGVSISSGSSAQIQGDGTNITRAVSPGSLINTIIMTSSGTYTPTTGVRFIGVEMVGGGGGGGSSANVSGLSNSVSVAAGGGGASYANGILPSQVYSVTVGSGGPGGSTVASNSSGNPGTAGTASSVGTIVAPGGPGGGAGNSISSIPAAGNTTSYSDLPSGTGLLFGFRGDIGIRPMVYSTTAAVAGGGGRSNFGPATDGRYLQGPGQTVIGYDGFGYGCGGGGGGSTGGAGGLSGRGGSGNSGIVIIKEYL